MFFFKVTYKKFKTRQIDCLLAPGVYLQCGTNTVFSVFQCTLNVFKTDHKPMITRDYLIHYNIIMWYKSEDYIREK